MGLIFLALAIVYEIAFGLTLKLTQGYTRWRPSLLNLAIWAALMYFVASAAMFMPISIVYPTWTGLGAVGITFGSVFLYQEKIDLHKVFFIALITVGVVGLEIG